MEYNKYKREKAHQKSVNKKNKKREWEINKANRERIKKESEGKKPSGQKKEIVTVDPNGKVKFEEILKKQIQTEVTEENEVEEEKEM